MNWLSLPLTTDWIKRKVLSFVLQRWSISRPEISQWLLILEVSRFAIHPVCTLLFNTHSHRSGTEPLHGNIHSVFPHLSTVLMAWTDWPTDHFVFVKLLHGPNAWKKLIGWWFLDVKGCSFVLYTHKCVPKDIGFSLAGCALHNTWRFFYFILHAAAKQNGVLLQCTHTFINSYKSCLIKMTNCGSEYSCSRQPGQKRF